MPADSQDNGRPTWQIVAVTIASVLLLGGIGTGLVLALSSDSDDQANLQTVTFQAPDDPGPDPFTEPADVESDRNVAIPVSGTGGEQPFGGSGSNRVCDRDKLIRFLKRNPERLRAWALALGIDPTYRAMRKYIAKLHPVTLTRDTPVTNHSFVDGRAVPFQAILQAGTAVLVDKYGKPVVRCFCGNPLLEPIYVKTAKCIGCPPHYTPPKPCRFNGGRNYDTITYRRDYYSNGEYDEVFFRSHRRSPYRNCYVPYPDPPTVTIVDVFQVPEEDTSTPSTSTGTGDPAISFSPSSGGQQTSFTMNLSGFKPNSSITVYLTRPDGVRETYNVTAGSNGTGQHYFPGGVTRVVGTYVAVATDPASGRRAQGSVTVVEEQQDESGGHDDALQCDPPRSQYESEQCAAQGR